MKLAISLLLLVVLTAILTSGAQKPEWTQESLSNKVSPKRKRVEPPYEEDPVKSWLAGYMVNNRMGAPPPDTTKPNFFVQLYQKGLQFVKDMIMYTKEKINSWLYD